MYLFDDEGEYDAHKIAGRPQDPWPELEPHIIDYLPLMSVGAKTKDGKPLPGASIEVEWVNDGSVKAPSDPFVTQVIKTDAAGTFSYALPKAGWWGFNALAEGKETKGPDGGPAKTELGGTIWVKAVDMK